MGLDRQRRFLEHVLFLVRNRCPLLARSYRGARPQVKEKTESDKRNAEEQAELRKQLTDARVDLRDAQTRTEELEKMAAAAAKSAEENAGRATAACNAAR